MLAQYETQVDRYEEQQKLLLEIIKAQIALEEKEKKEQKEEKEHNE